MSIDFYNIWHTVYWVNLQHNSYWLTHLTYILMLHYLGKQVRRNDNFQTYKPSYTLQLHSLKQQPVYLHNSPSSSSIAIVSIHCISLIVLLCNVHTTTTCDIILRDVRHVPEQYLASAKTWTCYRAWPVRSPTRPTQRRQHVANRWQIAAVWW